LRFQFLDMGYDFSQACLLQEELNHPGMEHGTRERCFQFHGSPCPSSVSFCRSTSLRWVISSMESRMRWSLAGSTSFTMRPGIEQHRLLAHPGEEGVRPQNRARHGGSGSTCSKRVRRTRTVPLPRAQLLQPMPFCLLGRHVEELIKGRYWARCTRRSSESTSSGSRTVSTMASAIVLRGF